jgi:hypothetical protein
MSMPWIATLSLLLPGGASAAGQDTPARLEGEKLEQLVSEIGRLVEERYIFPDVGRELRERLQVRLFEGAYEAIDAGALAARLTQDLRSVNDDRHLGVSPLDPRRRPAAVDPEQAAREREQEARRTNYGFQKLELLPGNIGYLDLHGFLPAAVAGDTAVGAMAFLANAEALIIDLRQNGGGDPTMIQLLSSYFFAEPTLLNTFQWRGQERIDQTWTLPHVPGKKLVELPLFVLTSGRTFSAAEEFTYNLKNLGRAVIVGETTGGGAHPGEFHEVGGVLSVFIPNGRAINPISGTNWEGTGVEPDLPVEAAQALDLAQRRAREAIEERRTKVTAR